MSGRPATRWGHGLAGAVLMLGLGLVSVAGAEPVLRWLQPPGTLLVGEPVDLAIMLDDTLAVRTFEVEIQLDGAVIEASEGQAGSLFEGLALYTDFENPEAGTWYAYVVVLGADEWAVGPGELFRWTIMPLAEGGTALATVDLGLRPPGGGDYPDASLPWTVLDVGDVTAALRPASPIASLRAHPNPFNPRTVLEIDAAASGPARLEVFDLRGRLVAELWHGVLPQGRWQMPWDARARGGMALGSGTYVLHLAGPTGTLATRRVTLLR